MSSQKRWRTSLTTSAEPRGRPDRNEPGDGSRRVRQNSGQKRGLLSLGLLGGADPLPCWALAQVRSCAEHHARPHGALASHLTLCCVSWHAPARAAYWRACTASVGVTTR